MRHLAPLALILAGSPALAAAEGKPFVSLANTDFVVLIAFILFIGVLIYFKVPGKVGEMLDKRAADIRSDLDEARSLREEAQALLASYERKQKDVQEQADRIVANARDEAQAAADQAKDDIRRSVERRLAAAEEQIESAQAGAIREVRDRAITVAIAAAREVAAAEISAERAQALIDQSIDTVDAKLH